MNKYRKCHQRIYLDRTKIFEVSYLKYADIIKRIEKTFVINGGTLHWFNIGNKFQPSSAFKTQYIGNNRLWYHMPDKINPDILHYVLFEDVVNFSAAYSPFCKREVCRRLLSTVVFTN